MAGHGPNQGRQRQCHIHQVLEDKTGLLYAPDLGADRVWLFARKGTQLEVSGWLQCPPGTGARHAVLTPDGTLPSVIQSLPLKRRADIFKIRDDPVCHRRTLTQCYRL
jgi:6-phosphogluconolactonase (cycloisomerase 2 family)